MVVFYEQVKARRYLSALKLIGVKEEMMRLLEFPGPRDSIPRTEWEHALGLKLYNWRLGGKRYGWNPGDYGAIGVQITSTSGTYPERAYSRYCFVYAAYLIHIARESFFGTGSAAGS